MSEKLFLVLNADGSVADADRSPEEAVLRAQRAARADGGNVIVDFTVDGDDGEGGLLPNGAEGPEHAYALSGLPEILLAKTGKDHLASKDVEAISVREAWERLRPFAPRHHKSGAPVKHWNATPGEFADHMMSQNAKLLKGQAKASMGHELTASMGLSLLPHQLAFRDERDIDPGVRAASAARMLPLLSQGLQSESDAMALLKETKFSTWCAGANKWCRDTCLVFSGQNEVTYEPYNAKRALSAMMLADPEAFGRMLLESVRRWFYRASVTGIGVALDPGDSRKTRMTTRERRGRKTPPGAFVRLNVYQDIPWEMFFPELFTTKVAFREPADTRSGKSSGKVVSDGMFYDYTKVRGRFYPKHNPGIKNYDVTFSYSGSNQRECAEALGDGQRVAVVFIAVKKGGKFLGGKVLRNQYKGDYYPWEWSFEGRSFPVCNADNSDIRPDDPEGCIAGLTYKLPVTRGSTAAERDAKIKDAADKFVVRVEKQGDVYVCPGTPASEGALDYWTSEDVAAE